MKIFIIKTINTHSFLFYSAAIIIHFFSFCFCEKDDFPHNWPWRGVSVSFGESSPADIVRIKKEININMVRFHVLANNYGKRKNKNGLEVMSEVTNWYGQMLNECYNTNYSADVNSAKKEIVGTNSLRWNTLRKIFK